MTEKKTKLMAGKGGTGGFFHPPHAKPRVGQRHCTQRGTKRRDEGNRTLTDQTSHPCRLGPPQKDGAQSEFEFQPDSWQEIGKAKKDFFCGGGKTGSKPGKAKKDVGIASHAKKAITKGHGRYHIDGGGEGSRVF